MKKRCMQFVAASLALALCVPPAWAARSDEDDIMLRVGLASTSSHNELGVQEAAHLQKPLQSQFCSVFYPYF